jgi:ParB-like chromosome segregation protein Spo0J
MERRDESIRIEYLPLATLLKAPRNPKDHDIGLLHDSFSRFGFVEPIALNERTGRLVAGHGRQEAL